MDNTLEKVLRKLAGFADTSSVLTIYLGTENKKSASPSVISSTFNSLVRQNIKKEDQKEFKKDLERISEYIETVYDGRGTKSLVFFTSGERLWEVLEFDFYLPPYCKVSSLPYIQPITEALERRKPYLVLLADREKARLFTVSFGKIKKQKEISDPQVPQKVKHGDDTWDQQGKIMRHIEDHLHRHLKLITQEVYGFVKDFPVKFIIVGGHKEIIPKIKKNLTYPLNKIVQGEFIIDLNTPLNDIFLKSKKIASHINEKK